MHPRGFFVRCGACTRDHAVVGIPLPPCHDMCVCMYRPILQAAELTEEADQYILSQEEDLAAIAELVALRAAALESQADRLEDAAREAGAYPRGW